MKRIALILGAILAMALQSFSAEYLLSTTTLSITNRIGTNDVITANIGGAVWLQTTGTVIAEFGATGEAAAATNAVVIQFIRSLDGTNWETSPVLSWTNTLTGTTAYWGRQSWAMSTFAAPWVKVKQISNAANTSGLTNLTLRISTQEP